MLATLVCLIFLIFLWGIGDAVKTQGISNAVDIWFMDIGQGDASLVATPEGRHILIDAGPNKQVVQQIGKLLPLTSKHLDLVFLSHYDKDHIGGMLNVLDTYSVGAVMVRPRNECTTDICSRTLKALDAKAIPVIEVMDSHEDISVEKDVVIDNLTYDNRSGVTNRCLVFRLVYGATHILFTGDMDSIHEKTMVASGEDVRADVLKVAHHGSKTASSDLFLQVVSPKLASISDGKNNQYHHPSDEILERFSHYPATVLARTDLDGTVHVACTKTECVRR